MAGLHRAANLGRKRLTRKSQFRTRLVSRFGAGDSQQVGDGLDPAPDRGFGEVPEPEHDLRRP